MNKQRIFITQVFETALFFRDMYEEGNDGQTTAIEWLKPVQSITNTDVRKFVLNDLYKSRKLTLTQAAIELAMWSLVAGQSPEFDINEIKKELTARCRVHERDVKFDTERDAQITRAFLRAARYMQLVSLGEVTAHSRIVEICIPEDFVPKGGTAGAGHREHVVPCAALREESVARFKNGATVEQVSEFLRRNVVIVEISKQQQELLDGAEISGGLGLRNKMPDGWQFDRDCIFARLHKAKIDFVPPPGFLKCGANNCTTVHAAN